MRPALLSLLASTIIAALAFALVVFRLDPHSGVAAPISFFLTAYLLLSCVLTFIVLGLRVWLQGTGAPNRALLLAFREGLLLSGLMVFLFVLQAFRVLTWWGTLIVIIVGFLIELSFFATLSDTRGQTEHQR